MNFLFLVCISLLKISKMLFICTSNILMRKMTEKCIWWKCTHYRVKKKKQSSYLALYSLSIYDTHQYKISLVCWEHKYRDIMVCQWSDDWFRDFRYSDWLRAGGVPAPGHHIESQPRCIGHTEILRLRQLWNRQKQKNKCQKKSKEKKSCTWAMNVTFWIYERPLLDLSKGTMWGMKSFKTLWNHDSFFSFVDVFAIETGSWGGAYQTVCPFWKTTNSLGFSYITDLDMIF